MKKLVLIIGVGSVFLFLSQQCAAPVSKNNKSDDIELINKKTPKKNDHYFLFLKASYQQARGNAAEALKDYQHLLRFNPSPQAYTGFLQLLSDIGQYTVILKIYEANQVAFKKAFKNNVAINLIIAQAYVSTDQDQKAESLFLELAKENPDNEQVAYFAAMAYLKNNQFDKALEFVDRCLQNQTLKQRFFLFHFLKSKILVQQNKPNDALKEIEKAIKLFPKFDRAILLKAMLLEQLGNINDAIKGYSNFIDLVGHDPTVEKQIVQLLFSQKRFSEALTYLKRLKQDSPDYYFDVALVEFKAGNHAKAIQQLDLAIQKAPQFTKARLLKVEVLLATKNITELLSFMHDWLISDAQAETVLHTLLLLRKANVPMKKIIKTLQDVETKKPAVTILAALADLSTETNNPKQAIIYYEKILATTDDATVKSKTRFHLGYTYFITKQYDKLEKTLETALTQDPVYPSVYNLLAFYYAQANKQLPRALELVEKALSFAPHCPYYLHTKATVLSLLGRKSEALDALKKALTSAPKDKVLLTYLKRAQGVKK